MIVTSPAIHVLVLGQSNVANHGKEQKHTEFGDCWCNGQRYPLTDPLPGGSGNEGSVWSRLASLLRATLAPERFSVTLLAQSGTSVADWAENGKCFDLLRRSVPTIKTYHPPVTHIFYHQGERDTFLKTPEEDYISRFISLQSFLDKTFPGIYCIVCTASHRMGVQSNAVRAAQRWIQSNLPNCVRGPDTDKFGENLRFDNTHFNAEGLMAFANDICTTLSELLR